MDKFQLAVLSQKKLLQKRGQRYQLPHLLLIIIIYAFSYYSTQFVYVFGAEESWLGGLKGLYRDRRAVKGLEIAILGMTSALKGLGMAVHQFGLSSHPSTYPLCQSHKMHVTGFWPGYFNSKTQRLSLGSGNSFHWNMNLKISLDFLQVCLLLRGKGDGDGIGRRITSHGQRYLMSPLEWLDEEEEWKQGRRTQKWISRSPEGAYVRTQMDLRTSGQIWGL